MQFSVILRYSILALSFVFLWCLANAPLRLYAQNSVGIGTDNPNPNSVLHLVAGEVPQGVLIPSLTTTDRTSEAFVSQLSEGENGLLVYDADERQFYHWTGNLWAPLASGEVGGDLFGPLSNLQLDTGVVRFENMADSAVSSAAIVNNTIQTEDLASPGANKVLISTDAGTVFWENLSLFETVSLMEGFVYVGSSNNQPIEVDMSGRGSLLIGNGTSATSVRVGGDGTLNESGVLTLSNSEQTRLNLGLDQSNVSITGGTIDGTTIGSDNPAPGSFTLVSGDGSAITDLNADNITAGTIGFNRLPNVPGGAIVYGDATQNNPITSIKVDA